MARPNGPQSPPPGGRAPRPDPQNWAQGAAPAARPAARPAQPQQPAPSYPAQSAGAAYQQAAYGSQQAQQPDPRYAQPAPAAQPARAAKPASAFDTLLAQEDPHSYGAQLPYNGNGAYPQAAYAAPAPAATPSPAYGRDANAGRDYGQRASTQQAAQPSAFDSSWGNDQAGYAGSPGQSGYASQAQAGYGQNVHYAAQANSQFGSADDWGQGDTYGQHGHEPSLEPPFGDAHGYGQPEHPSGIEQSYAEDDEYEEEPRRRGRLPMIAAAAIGALLCGGGLAYGYKSFLGPGLDGKTPLIRSSADPSKVKPDDPGGRKFAHSDNKIMGGPLNDAGGETTGSVTGPTDGARKVPTMEVRPDGSMVPASGSGPAPDKPAMTASAMDFPTAGDTGAKAGAPPAPEKPTVISKAEPTPPAVAASPAPVAQDIAADDVPPAPAPKKVTPKKIAAAAAPEGPIGPQPTGAGWVAVLASAPVSASSQMDSLKQFADMQQKYGDVLGDKTPSVQEANLGEKGRYHRLVVGPPGSRDSASSICGSLKSQGYNGCWVMQY